MRSRPGSSRCCCEDASVQRVDDRRVIFGIVRMLKSGARWRDCPPEYGPYMTIYKRLNRWSRQGFWGIVYRLRYVLL